MAMLFKFLASAVGAAALCTVILALFARPLSEAIRHLIYSPRKGSRTYTTAASR